MLSPAEWPAPKPEAPEVEKLLQQLVRETRSRSTKAVNPTVTTSLEGMTDSIISGSQDYLQNAEGKQFSCVTGLSSPELDVIRHDVLRNRLMGYGSSREVKDPLLLPQQVNLCDAEISLDQLRSEGLQQWNMDMDIEYQYETFNGLPVYYGGDMYDSEDTEEFVPNAPDTLERMMCTERLLDGGDNRSVNAVNMTPMCRTVSKGVRGESDEFSDTSTTDTAELEELDSTDCDIEMDVWEDMDCPVLISGSSVDNSLCLSGQTMSSHRDVAYMGDFADEDFIDTGFDLDMGSEAEFEWNAWNGACAWELWSASEHSRALPAESVKDVVYYRDISECLESDICCTGIQSVNCAERYIDGAGYLVRLCLLEQPSRRDVGVRCDNANDWSLKHSFTIDWDMCVADSSRIAVCYDCLCLIVLLRTMISLFYDGMMRSLTEFKGLRRVQILSETMYAGRRQRMCTCITPPGICSAGRNLRHLIGRRASGGGSGGHTEIARAIGAVDVSAGGIGIAYIKKALGASQLVVSAPVTGSLVSISLFSPRDITETVGFPRKWTAGDTDWVLQAGFQVRLQVIAEYCSMNAVSPVLDNRGGNTFGMDLYVAWDAPEAVVDDSSAGVVPLCNLPDVIGLVGRRDNATESRLLQGRDSRSIRVLVLNGWGLDQNFHDVTIVDMGDLPESHVSMLELAV